MLGWGKLASGGFEDSIEQPPQREENLHEDLLSLTFTETTISVRPFGWRTSASILLAITRETFTDRLLKSSGTLITPLNHNHHAEIPKHLQDEAHIDFKANIFRQVILTSTPANPPNISANAMPLTPCSSSPSSAPSPLSPPPLQN